MMSGFWGKNEKKKIVDDMGQIILDFNSIIISERETDNKYLHNFNQTN